MESEAEYHRKTSYLLAAVAVVMGVVLGLLALALRSAFETAAAFPSNDLAFFEAKAAPYFLFAVLSAGFGWTITRMAEARGIVSWVIVAGSVIVVVGLGWVFSACLSSTLSRAVTYAFAVSAVGFVGGGVYALGCRA